MWFRPELVRTVNWAGDPTKSVVKGQEPARLSPRGSFALWKQTVRGQAQDWTAADRFGDVSAASCNHVNTLDHDAYAKRGDWLEELGND